MLTAVSSRRTDGRADRRSGSTRCALPEYVTDWLIAEFEQEQQLDRDEAKGARENIRGKIKDLDEKLERLMNLYLEKALTLEEYRGTKNQLVTERGVLTSSLTAFEHTRSIPFEPAIRFVKALKHGALVAHNGNPTEQCDFLRKTASNFSLRDHEFNYEFRKQWELVADQQFPDAHENPAPDAGAGLATEIAQLAKMRCLRDNLRSFFTDNPTTE